MRQDIVDQQRGSFRLAPQLGQIAKIRAGFYWLFPVAVWIGYEFESICDQARHEWSGGHTVTLGRVFQTCLGLSLEYGSRDR